MMPTEATRRCAWALSPALAGALRAGALRTGALRAGVLRIGLSLVWAGAALASPDAPETVAPECTEAVTQRIQSRYDSINDLSARFEQTTTAVSMGASPGASKEGPLRGRVVFAKPGRMRWVYEEPRPSELTTDGTTLWLYDPVAKEVQRLTGAESYLNGAALQFLLGEGTLKADFEIRAKRCALVDGAPVGIAVLDLIPKQAASYERLGLQAKADSGEILETTLVDLFGNLTRIAFSETRENTSPAADTFVFKIPDGVEVIELSPPR